MVKIPNIFIETEMKLNENNGELDEFKVTEKTH